MNYPQVPLILLAAGESRRMGTPKQLLSYKGNSLIRHAVTEAVKSNCDRIIVVLGANCDRISGEISDLPICVTYNTQWQQGMSTSIATGIKALLQMKVNSEAIIIALADQPFINAQVYNRLIERYCQNQLKAVASNYSDTLGVPALFDRTLIPELLKMKQKGGAKQILNQYSDRAFNLDLPEAAVDIDTPADYQKLLKI
ncbi:nucleotidyltransferase family protein [Pleurocapsa sp. FMAR1]|uniref:nucleotidyltransferase family protein n=1 Tax=Pleurocapsa sp. FMAR1 TaxID=3040204 RepID=UPI0029C84CC3|nr:nucleotidyltransferase family protein [Pleurocapsa sp. FMAR1]